ncbi:MAG: hypothetical protein ACXAEF_14980 [Candidatus Thorarchaeota archaeon]
MSQWKEIVLYELLVNLSACFRLVKTPFAEIRIIVSNDRPE